jgi:ectoine hydroxylase-related dioxygenase (phytanoyl-CoA dioxygenase family)
MIFKPATAGRDTPWHQDEAYWEQPKVTAHSLSVWTPLDDVTVDSGCMQFRPDHTAATSHPSQRGSRSARSAEDPPDEHERRLPDRGRCATVHHCRTIHYSGPNYSARPRRAISALIHGPVVQRDEPLERTWLPLAPKFLKS